MKTLLFILPIFLISTISFSQRFTGEVIDYEKTMKEVKKLKLNAFYESKPILIKRNIGEKIWFMYDNKPVEGIIIRKRYSEGYEARTVVSSYNTVYSNIDHISLAFSKYKSEERYDILVVSAHMFISNVDLSSNKYYYGTKEVYFFESKEELLNSL